MNLCKHLYIIFNLLSGDIQINGKNYNHTNLKKGDQIQTNIPISITYVIYVHTQ